MGAVTMMFYYIAEPDCCYLLQDGRLWECTPQQASRVLDENEEESIQYNVAIIHDMPEAEYDELPKWARYWSDFLMDGRLSDDVLVR